MMYDIESTEIMNRWRNNHRNLAYMEALCTSTDRTFYIVGYEAWPYEFDPHQRYHWEPGPVFFNYGEAIEGTLRVVGIPMVSWKNTFSDRCDAPCPYCARITSVCPWCKRWFCNFESRPFPILRHFARVTQEYCPHCGTKVTGSGGMPVHSKPILIGRFG